MKINFIDQITKLQVDTFKPGQKLRVPYCQLRVKFAKDGHPTEIVHTVELQGAKKLCNFFAITCPPKGNIPILVNLAMCMQVHYSCLRTSSTAEYARVTGGNRRQLERTEEGGKWYTKLVTQHFPYE